MLDLCISLGVLSMLVLYFNMKRDNKFESDKVIGELIEFIAVMFITIILVAVKIWQK